MFRSNYCYTVELKKVELKRLHLAFVDGLVDRICIDFGILGGVDLPRPRRPKVDEPRPRLSAIILKPKIS